MRLVLSARARALLRRLPRSNVYSIAELVLIALLAVQCARLVWAVVTPVTPLGDWRPARPGVAGAPGEMLRGFDPFFRLSSGEAPAAVTSLQLTLYGIRVNEATGSGSAIIATPDGTQKSYAVGDEIMPGAMLKGVAFDHISIDRGGTVEDLYIDQSKPAPTVDPLPAGVNPTINAPRITLQDINSATFKTFELFLFAAIWYLLLTTILGFGQKWLEHRMARHETPLASATAADLSKRSLLGARR